VDAERKQRLEAALQAATRAGNPTLVAAITAAIEGRREAYADPFEGSAWTPGVK